jgi:hypothetical protein
MSALLSHILTPRFLQSIFNFTSSVNLGLDFILSYVSYIVVNTGLNVDYILHLALFLVYFYILFSSFCLVRIFIPQPYKNPLQVGLELRFIAYVKNYHWTYL